MDFYGTGWREGGETWKCVEGGGDYLDAPFNHFIPDSTGDKGVMSTMYHCYQGQYSP